MKKRVIAIVVMVALVMSMVACGSTQAQPVQESTPAPKTETAVKPAEETKVETPAEEHTHPSDDELFAAATSEKSSEYVIDGVDFKEHEEYNTPYESIIEEQAEFDAERVFVVRDAYGKDDIEAILSNGDSLTCAGEGVYYFIFYSPKNVTKTVQVEQNMERFVGKVSEEEKIIARGYFDQTGDSIPVGIEITYEDGAEETFTIYVTKTK